MTKTRKEVIKDATAFFKARFERQPKEDKAYFEEWVDRFRTGEPENSMDSKSLKVWEKIKNGTRIN